VEATTRDHEKLFIRERHILAESRLLANNAHLTSEEIRGALQSMIKNYEDLLDQTTFLTRISDRLEQRLNSLNLSLNQRNTELKQALTELTEAQRSKRTYFIIYLMATGLFVFEEIIVDPVMKNFDASTAIVMGLKLIVALLLKPAESVLQKMLMRR
jgi:hypothetical protein